MATNELPPCGLYRTTTKIGDCEADRLVYFHNHGDPGPGFYFPEKWVKNRAQFSVDHLCKFPVLVSHFFPFSMQRSSRIWDARIMGLVDMYRSVLFG